MPTKKKTDEGSTPAAEAAKPAAEAAKPAAEAAEAAAKDKPAKAAPPKFALYQKASGSYTIAGIPFPPFTPVRTPALLADRIDGSVDPDVMRVYETQEKAELAAKALKAKLTPSTGADD